MTQLDVMYRYGVPPGEAAMMALGRIREVYGIRGLVFDEPARFASSMTPPASPSQSCTACCDAPASTSSNASRSFRRSLNLSHSRPQASSSASRFAATA